jgi:2-polyprenyl-3-methyl-5-hydroxy-6-metoxy-1,4-benzoquinol methylase
VEAKYYHKQAVSEDSHWWYLGRRAVIQRVLSRFSRNTGAVLEVGCGSGGSLPMLSACGDTMTAVEMEPSAADVARKRGIGEIAQGRLGEPLAVFNRRYDLVAMFDVLEHIPDDRQALSDVRKLLTPEGRLIITVPAYQFLWSQHDLVAHHQRRYRRSQIVRLLRERGFSVLYASYFNTLLFPSALITLLFSRVLSASPDIAMRQPWKPINWLLTKVFQLERFLIPWLRLPFGLSIVLVAEIDKAH